MNNYYENATLHDHLIKQARLVFRVSITGNGTPASKTHAVDLPGVAYLRTEGLTAAADAVDATISWTTAVDNSTGDSQFGVLIAVGDADVIHKVGVTEITSLATSLAATNPASTAGNIAVDIAGTGLNLASESPTLVIEVDYDRER